VVSWSELLLSLSARPLLEQPHVIEAAIAIDAALHDEPIPELFFLPL
jgi:hypothetical protein